MLFLQMFVMAYGLFFLKIKQARLTFMFVCVGRLSVLFRYELVFVASVQIQASLSDFATVVCVVIWA